MRKIAINVISEMTRVVERELIACFCSDRSRLLACVEQSWNARAASQSSDQLSGSFVDIFFKNVHNARTRKLISTSQRFQLGMIWGRLERVEGV
jgi:hypothetical protein